MKIVQTPLFSSCAARFGQIAFLSVKVCKFVTLAWNSRQNGKTVSFPWKFYKTLFSGHAQHVLAKSNFWASKFTKSKTGLKCSSNQKNSAPSKKIVQNPLFRSCAGRFGQIAFQIGHTGLKFSPKREISGLFMKIVQDALARMAKNGQNGKKWPKWQKMAKMA